MFNFNATTLPEVILKLEEPGTTIVDAYKEVIEIMDTLDDNDHVKPYLKQRLEKCVIYLTSWYAVTLTILHFVMKFVVHWAQQLT